MTQTVIHDESRWEAEVTLAIAGLDLADGTAERWTEDDHREIAAAILTICGGTSG